jgi:hypothetical protein
MRIRIRYRIEVKNWIRIRNNVMRIRNPASFVADPNPNPDPYVFGPPGSESGSISQRYGSGFISQRYGSAAKISWILNTAC